MLRHRMPDPDDFSALGDQHVLDDEPIPAVVTEFAAGHPFVPEWRNDLAGLTFDVGDHYIKWNPRRSGIDLQRERERLEWLAGRHPAPRVVEYGTDNEAQWLITEALPGRCAVGDEWRARRPEAINALAEGLRAITPFRLSISHLVGHKKCGLVVRPGRLDLDRQPMTQCSYTVMRVRRTPSFPMPVNGWAMLISETSVLATDGRT